MQVLHQGGGAGSVTSTLHLSLGLARFGFQIRFVCPPGSEVEILARAAGLEVYPLELVPRARRTNAARIATLLARYPVHLVNSQSARDREALTWLGLTRRLQIPLVVTRRQMPRTFILENWLTGRVATRVVAVSPSVAQALARRGTPRRKLTVIPNGLVTDRVPDLVSPAVVEEWRRRIGWDASHRTIGIVSRAKDHAVVLTALEWVRTPVRLVLAGVDPSSALGRLAVRVPPRHAAICIPFGTDVRGLYELLELVLLPSRMEGLSQALLEAMALGKPVIASAAAGNIDLITSGRDGRLVEPLDPRSWANAVEQLLENPSEAEQLGRRARRTARESYDLRLTVERTASLYTAILESTHLG
jgi:L-malate glycosyltransferase